MPDALAAIGGLLEHEPAVNPHLIFVLGHSQGGTYAPLIAKDAPEVAGVILLAAGAERSGRRSFARCATWLRSWGRSGPRPRRSCPRSLSSLHRWTTPPR